MLLLSKAVTHLVISTKNLALKLAQESIVLLQNNKSASK